jgi:4-hydroxy-tetrahydrodipicolinate synthase
VAQSTRFSGIFTALITPFKNGAVDEKAFQSLVEWQVFEGINGLVPCGTTGESPTLSHAEHMRVVELCVEAANGKVPVMAGSGSNSTEEAIVLTRHAQDAGADAALVVAPYYNKPSQEGIYQHFKHIAQSVDIPIFIYNIPGRSVVNISDETLARLARLPNIAGIKDATGDLTRPLTLRALDCADFIQLSGEDMTAVGFNASGGVGCISVTSNIAPRLCAEVQAACLSGDYVTALAKHEKLVPLHQAMFCETSPAPVKFAASLQGRSTPDVRLPLVPASPDCQQRVRRVMQALDMV